MTADRWQDYAACAETDPELFFADANGGSAVYEHARVICARCPVRLECLQYALRHEAGHDKSHRYGMYGGLTPGERARLVNRRVA